MSYQVELENRPAQPAAVVRGHATAEGLPAFLGGAFDEVMRVLSAQRLAPSGPPFGRYTSTGDGFDIEAGFPCSAPVTPSGRVEADALPAGPAAVVLHRGSYDAVASAYEAATSWMEEHGYVPSGVPWEAYLDEPDIAEPRTLVTAPCRRSARP